MQQNTFSTVSSSRSTATATACLQPGARRANEHALGSRGPRRLARRARCLCKTQSTLRAATAAPVLIRSPEIAITDSSHTTKRFSATLPTKRACEAGWKRTLQLADWDLLYSQNGVAFDQYARVHELLEDDRHRRALDRRDLRAADSDRLADVPAEPTRDGGIGSLHRRGLRSHEVWREPTRRDRRRYAGRLERRERRPRERHQGRPVSAESDGRRARSCVAGRRSLLLGLGADSALAGAR